MQVESIKNKVIVISGGTKGIGRQLAKTCVMHGCNVVIGGRDQLAADMIIDELKGAVGNIVFVPVNLGRIEDCQRMFEVAIQNFGRLDGFVNYAGITPVASLTDCDEVTYDEIMDVNIKSAFFCTQHAIKKMLLTGGGSIVLVGSAHSWSGQKDRGPYAVSKGALFTLFEHIARNYAMDQIRCNFVTMGWTATDGELALRASVGESEIQLKERAAKVIPMGRMLTADDHIPAMIYLLSDDSRMITGSNIRVTGGEYI
jgi:NAD(P)-dependent dehydrogenase (short-subunit alcohol dehydrogenase family)